MNDYDEVLEKFKAYLEVTKTKSTTSYYLSIVRKFLRFVNKKIDDIIIDDVILFLSKIKNRASAATHARVLKSFFKWLKRMDLYENIPVPRYERKLPEWVEEDKIMRVVDNFIKLYRMRGDKKLLLEICIILISYELALRRSEVVLLNRSDFDPEKCEVKVRKVKYGMGQVSEKPLPISKKLCSLLKEYLSIRTDNDPALFVSMSTGKRISKEFVRRVAKSFGRIINKEDFRHHMFRHSRATNLAIKGADLIDLVEILRHENPRNTMIYLHMTSKHIRERLRRLGEEV